MIDTPFTGRTAKGVLLIAKGMLFDFDVFEIENLIIQKFS